MQQKACTVAQNSCMFIERLGVRIYPKSRLSSNRVCPCGSATSAVLGKARDRGMAGVVNGNATPAGLGRAPDRGVAAY